MDSGLLAQIQKGKSLKKAQTNDRSAPVVAPSKPSGGASMGGMARPPLPGGMMNSAPSLQHTASAPPVAAPAAPQLGGLFANGMPTLRKTRGAVNTGRGAASPSTPPAPPPPTPGRSPAFKPPTVSSHNTLPRNFKAPPPIPGRGLPQFNQSAPSTPPPPPPPPPSSQNGAPPPPPPPPPPSGIAPGMAPKIQQSLTSPGRSRSNSSPSRPVPPPPPRVIPSPPGSPASSRGPPKFGLPLRPPTSSLAVPPVLPPGRPRSSSNASQRQSPTPPRSPLPPPPPALSPPGPPPSFGSRGRQVPLTEANGRFTFRPTSDLPQPRIVRISKHTYPSGEVKGNAYPLDYSGLN